MTPDHQNSGRLSEELKEFVWENGHLWDEHRAKQVEQAADQLAAIAELIAAAKAVRKELDDEREMISYGHGRLRDALERIEGTDGG